MNDKLNWLRALLFLWVLPAGLLVWLFYLLPFMAAGYLKPNGWAAFGVVRLRVTTKDNWYSRAWSGWKGNAMPFAILLRHDADTVDEVHELRHTDQWLTFGFLLYPLLYGFWLIVYGYRDSPFERDARRYAGG